jgi:hypothetical protein
MEDIVEITRDLQAAASNPLILNNELAHCNQQADASSRLAQDIQSANTSNPLAKVNQTTDAINALVNCKQLADASNPLAHGNHPGKINEQAALIIQAAANIQAEVQANIQAERRTCISGSSDACATYFKPGKKPGPSRQQ